MIKKLIRILSKKNKWVTVTSVTHLKQKFAHIQKFMKTVKLVFFVIKVVEMDFIRKILGNILLCKIGVHYVGGWHYNGYKRCKYCNVKIYANLD